MIYFPLQFHHPANLYLFFSFLFLMCNYFIYMIYICVCWTCNLGSGHIPLLARSKIERTNNNDNYSIAKKELKDGFPT